MKVTDSNYKQIIGIVDSERLVSNRVEKLEALGYFCSERRCGSGGKGQIIELKNETRVQVGYGHGRQNYAMCVIINK